MLQEPINPTQNAENTAKIVRGVPFQKGDDPRRMINPKAKGSKHFTTLFRDLLKESITLKDGTTMTIGQAMTKAMTNKAIRGDVSAFNAVADRVDGKAQQALELSGDLNVTNMEPEQRALIENAIDDIITTD